jgi:hypothetical protein
LDRHGVEGCCRSIGASARIENHLHLSTPTKVSQAALDYPQSSNKKRIPLAANDRFTFVEAHMAAHWGIFRVLMCLA